ncbi:MAG: RpoL/Rpb11 RNA polymerase subunit family protein [Candidatus Micrarchaeia archaeon]
MTLKYVVNEKNHIEVEFEGEDITIPSLLKEVLLKDRNVDFVTYVTGHPERDNPKLVLKTNKKDAREVLKDAFESVIATLSEMKEEADK